MNKNDFLLDLEEIINDKIFLGRVKYDLHHEISANKWAISMNIELANQISVSELMDFFSPAAGRRRNRGFAARD